MWWLHERTQMKRQELGPTSDRISPPPELLPAGRGPSDLAAEPQPNCEISPDSNHRPRPRQVLRDTLTPEQNAANLRLLEIQCGHEPEITRLITDIKALENHTKSQSLALDQATQRAEEAEQVSSRLADELQTSQRVAATQQSALEESLKRSEHELATAHQALSISENDLSQRSRESDHHRREHAILAVHHAAAIRQNSLLLSQLDDRHRTTLDQQTALQQSQATMLRWERAGDAWEQQAYHLRNQADQRTAETAALERELSHCREQLVASEHAREQLQHKSQTQAKEIASLQSVRQELAGANQRIEIWQSETQRSNADKRAINEQLSRLETLSQEQVDEIEKLRRRLAEQQRTTTKLVKSLTTQVRVGELKSDRLKTEISVLLKAQQQLDAELHQQRVLRSSETSQHQRQQHQRRLETNTLQTQLAEKTEELTNAWQACQECTDRLHIQEEALSRAKDNETRLTEIHWSQCIAMNTKCDELMVTLETERESVQLAKLQHEQALTEAHQRYEQAAQRSAQLESQYESLETQRKSDQATAERERASAEAMLSQATKLRAQLSGGRARGKLLIEQYETKLERKRATIEDLKTKIAALQDTLTGSNNAHSFRRDAA